MNKNGNSDGENAEKEERISELHCYFFWSAKI